MSRQSIKAFEARHPELRPRPAVRLRNEAAKLRAQAQHIHAKLHAQANVMEDMANELDGATCPGTPQDESWTGPGGDAWIAAGHTKD